MPWSQWSLTVRSYFGRGQPDGDPVAAAGGNKRGRSDHRRQHDDDRSGETTFNTAVLWTCRKRALQVVQQVPRGYGFEAWRQLCRKFGPHPPVRSRGMLQALLSLTKSAEPRQLVRRWRNRRKVCVRGVRLAVSKTDDEGSCSSGNGRVSPSKTGVCGVWRHEPHRPGAVGQKKKVTSQRNQRSTSAGGNLATARVHSDTSQL